MERESFVFYRSFYEGIKELPRDIQGEVLTAIMEYGLNGVTTENQKPITKAMFALIKPQLDANNQRFENGRLGAEHGKKGGRPKKEKPQENPNLTPNVNDNVNVNDNDDKDASAITDEKKYYSSDNGVIKSISELKRDYLNDENLCNAIIKNLKVIDKNILSE